MTCSAFTPRSDAGQTEYSVLQTALANWRSTTFLVPATYRYLLLLVVPVDFPGRSSNCWFDDPSQSINGRTSNFFKPSSTNGERIVRHCPVSSEMIGPGSEPGNENCGKAAKYSSVRRAVWASAVSSLWPTPHSVVNVAPNAATTLAFDPPVSC
ncbi:hypothetical protein ASE15_03150 [Oerskovia sp. Root22]|nr:hypothetical protein ASE15_03150 [Oerskovia sp. Root22]